MCEVPLGTKFVNPARERWVALAECSESRRNDIVMSNQIAIVAALEYEVKAGLKNWRVNEREHSGHRFKFYESQRAVLVCGGIGPEPARRATEAIITLYKPMLVVSLGFAGALDPQL